MTENHLHYSGNTLLDPLGLHAGLGTGNFYTNRPNHFPILITVGQQEGMTTLMFSEHERKVWEPFQREK